MGQSSSSGRRENYQPSNYAFAGNGPPSRPGYSHSYRPPPPHNSYSQRPGYGSNPVRFSDPLIPPPLSPSSSAPPPPPFVEHQQAKTVKNDVNVNKGTIRLEPDECDPDHHLVSFTFDALADGSVTIYYFAKEGTNCSFYPIYADMYMPMKVPFRKGPGQKFRQPSGSGIDLGFFELDDLVKPLDGDVYPLVIYAEACSPTDEQVGQSKAAARTQITQAVIEKHNNGSFQVKVIKQILWVNGERYELREIFGRVNSAEVEFGGSDDMGKECVICMSEPRDTAVLPCRHLCMCSGCAKELRLQSSIKCPICRQPIESLIEIKEKSAGR